MPTDEIDDAFAVIELIEQGKSKRQTSKTTGVNRSTVTSIIENKDMYLKHRPQ